MIEATSGISAVPATAAEPVRPVPREAAPQTAPETEISKKAAEAVETTLRALDPPLMGQHERLSISRDEATGTFIYRSIDRKTGEVIRQWPVEAMLQFKAYLRNAEGVLIDSKV
ncbi:MAG: flagellar protein FlaG [Micropepsaceae bacterium]